MRRLTNLYEMFDHIYNKDNGFVVMLFFYPSVSIFLVFENENELIGYLNNKFANHDKPYIATNDYFNQFENKTGYIRLPVKLYNKINVEKIDGKFVFSIV